MFIKRELKISKNKINVNIGKIFEKKKLLKDVRGEKILFRSKFWNIKITRQF